MNVQTALLAVAVGLGSPQTLPGTDSPASPPPSKPDAAADRVAEIIADRLPQLHGSANWRQRTAVEAELKIEFSGTPILDGTLTYETNRRRARIDLKDGGSLIFDGHDVYVDGTDMNPERARQHLENWPRIFAIPFRLRDRDVEPRTHRSVYLKGVNYDSITLVFKSPQGKETGDWRLVYSDVKSHMIRGIANLPLHAFVKDSKPQDQFAVMFDDYIDVEGVKLATRWTFWKWDNDLIGEPIGQATATNIKFVNPPAGAFEKATVPPPATQAPPERSPEGSK